MVHINNGGEGYKAGCGKTGVNVSYLWDDVDCPECLKLRPTKRAADGGDSSPSDEKSQTQSVNRGELRPSPRHR